MQSVIYWLQALLIGRIGICLNIKYATSIKRATAIFDYVAIDFIDTTGCFSVLQ